MKLKHCLLLILLVSFISGCTKESEKATEICVQACKDAINVGDIEAGPCLLDPITEYENWACDIIHDPREMIDNLEKNQCQSFNKGKAQHFIELKSDCKVIRVF